MYIFYYTTMKHCLHKYMIKLQSKLAVRKVVLVQLPRQVVLQV